MMVYTYLGVMTLSDFRAHGRKYVRLRTCPIELRVNSGLVRVDVHVAFCVHFFFGTMGFRWEGLTFLVIRPGFVSSYFDQRGAGPIFVFW